MRMLRFTAQISMSSFLAFVPFAFSSSPIVRNKKFTRCLMRLRRSIFDSSVLPVGNPSGRQHRTRSYLLPFGEVRQVAASFHSLKQIPRKKTNEVLARSEDL